MTEQPLRAAGAPAPEITCLVAPNPGPLTLQGTCTYIVRDGDQVWIVDPGPRDAAHLEAILDAALMARGARAAGILLTHRHDDHAAGAGTLRRRLSGTARRDVPLWAVDTAAVPGAIRPPGRLLCDRGTMGHVIHLPGHTADSVALLVEGGRLLVGDTLLGGSSTVIVPPDGDLTAYLQSLQVLRALCLDGRIFAILPGHGEPFEDPAAALAAVEDAISHRLARIDAVREARARGVLTMPRLLREIYGPDLPAELEEGATWNILAATEHIRRTG